GAAGDSVRGRWAVQWLCLSMTVTILVPLFILGQIIDHHAAIGAGLLDLFVDFAQFLGEPGLENSEEAGPSLDPGQFRALQF
ncbi:MAG: hypothetical protein AAGF76_07115, partial [Pseudomonadota bacterium]